ncbi:Rv3654c family TadE-like protein [Goodfellowiella coeruleoviolacea]|uniref:Helicase/secretion neighborhood TadE-like protein n=1 Tax=Goodfellowiella coeruleoviolacea TaxID=334858 RepID=A0AAE3GC16_9PSEU|nr:Rv3654c family TadE-like protein [Goodfellowiella coeruleoviolacea]MCP2164634.1 helicase/secretion neighborhood TadE-like protein [Goodfellowiella coeruleoviolacea]
MGQQEERRGDPDRGSASVLAVAVIAVLLGLAALGVAVATAVTTRHRAASAADLAALAGAAHVLAGRQEACQRADWVARRMRVELTGCVVVGRDVLVAVAARPPEPLALLGTTNARARAGPTEGLTPDSATNGR